MALAALFGEDLDTFFAGSVHTDIFWLVARHRGRALVFRTQVGLLDPVKVKLLVTSRVFRLGVETGGSVAARCHHLRKANVIIHPDVLLCRRVAHLD